MKSRCNDKNNKDYGGRGITYEERWEKFENFYDDMKDGYNDSLTIERIDVNGNYCRENCTWITMYDQASNKRNTIRIHLKDGSETSLRNFCIINGVKPDKFYKKLKNKEITIDEIENQFNK